MYNESVNLDNRMNQALNRRENMTVQVYTREGPRWLVGDTLQDIADQAFALGASCGPNPNIPLFKDYSLEVLEKYKHPTVKNTTYSGYMTYTKNYFIPTFGDMYIDKITPQVIQSYLNDNSGLAAKTLKEHLRLLIQIFDYAIAEDYILKNPAQNKIIRIPSRIVTVREALNEDDLIDIFDNLGKLSEADARVIAFYMFTGLRRGEFAGLQRKDISSNFITISKEVTYTHNQPYIDYECKTSNARRKIPVLDILRPFIGEGDPEEYLFGGKKKPVSLMTIRNTLIRIEKRINLHGATPHIFRHTFATICNNAGLDIRSTKTILGHATSDITVGRYEHSYDSQLLEAGKKINDEYYSLFAHKNAVAI